MKDNDVNCQCFTAFEVPQFKGTIVHNMTVMEVLLVSLCLLLWAVSVAVFLRKWGRIRILQPQEPRYRYSPKNLETIKVVLKLNDPL